MQTPGQVSVPMRAGKKMRKRRELDALAPGGRRLLAGSSDEREDSWPWTGGSGGPPRRVRPRRACAPAARACAALLLCACATATATVVWLFIDVREQISSLRTEMELVSIGSQGVGDALQRCHSTTRELQYNHTEMAARLDKLILRTDNLTSQVAALQLGLANVKQQVASAPELINVPEQLSTLGTNVARFGSQIKDFDSTVAALRLQTSTLTDGQTLLSKNLTELKNQIDQMWNRSYSSNNDDKTKLVPLLKQQSDLQATLTQLSTNVTLINETLATKIDWATQDFKSDHRKVVELMESVQNNSVTLSSLETAWKQSNDILSRNITSLNQKVADKAAEVQRQFIELKNLINQLEKNEEKQISDITIARDSNSKSMPADVAAGIEDMTSDMLPKQISPYKNPELPKLPSTTTLLPLPLIKATPPTVAVTGKPSILSSGSA